MTCHAHEGMEDLRNVEIDTSSLLSLCILGSEFMISDNWNVLKQIYIDRREGGLARVDIPDISHKIFLKLSILSMNFLTSLTFVQQEK